MAQVASISLSDVFCGKLGLIGLLHKLLSKFKQDEVNSEPVALGMDVARQLVLLVILLNGLLVSNQLYRCVLSPVTYTEIN